MQDFFSWLAERGLASRPWLLLGKGPTFDRRTEFGLGEYEILTLNHAIREQKARVAHAIDLDVATQCGEILERNAEVVVMPWVPHVKNRPGTSTLAQLSAEAPILRRLADAGRLLWYNLSTAPVTNGSSPIVPVRFFSAEAALNLLAAGGVRKVRSLGMDGGQSYSSSFTDLSGTTLLANGRSSFDRQFESIAAAIFRTGVDFAPLDVESPVRVFVGATPDQWLATRVLEYTIRRSASMTTVVTPLYMMEEPIPTPADPANRPRTPFSFQRFLIPQAVGHRGHAIYLDSDMQVFHDIKELWQMPMNGAPLLSAAEGEGVTRRPQFSVMLLDCQRLAWQIPALVARLDSGELTYSQLVYEMKVAPGFQACIPSTWNSLERYEEGETRLLHFTDMNLQPWLSTQNPLAYLWCRALFEAVEAGYVTAEDIRREVASSNVRPSLQAQLDGRIADPLLLSKAAKALDRGYSPPHELARAKGFSPWQTARHRIAASLREGYQLTPLPAIRRKLRDRLSR